MDYSVYFKDQQVDIPGFGKIPFSVYKLGELYLPTGRLVACDPLTGILDPPLELNLQPGQYLISVSVAKIKYADKVYNKAAFSEVRINKKKPIYWEPIFPDLDEADNSCCAIDACVFGYLDELTANIMDNESYEEEYEKSYTYKIERQLEEFNHKTSHLTEWRCADVALDIPPKSNVIAFHPGWGNGCYASYGGYDNMKNLVTVVTDFEIFFKGVCSPETISTE